MSLIFVHHGSHCLPVADGLPTKLLGNSVWIATSKDSQCIALAFDWAMVEQDVPVVADPFRVTSNLWPVDESGVALSEVARFRILNTLVWSLKWQSTVNEHLTVDLTAVMPQS